MLCRGTSSIVVRAGMETEAAELCIEVLVGSEVRGHCGRAVDVESPDTRLHCILMDVIRRRVPRHTWPNTFRRSSARVASNPVE
jgi:hypothetical protein